MKHTVKRILSSLLVLVMVLSMAPQLVTPAKAAGDPNYSFSVPTRNDSAGWNRIPTSFSGRAIVALYFDGDTFPGEPRSHSNTASYIRYSNTFEVDGNGYFKVDEILKDVRDSDKFVVGEDYFFWATSGIFDANGLDDEWFTDNFNAALAAREQNMVADVIAAKKEEGQLTGSENPADYEIVWYVIKYQTADSLWHINGLIREKDKYSVTYDGNGHTAGSPPDGVIDMSYAAAQSYAVQGKNDLERTNYTFKGWNTKADGTGVFYTEGQTADLTTLDQTSITLYAQWAEKATYSVTWLNGDGNAIHMDTGLHSGDTATYESTLPTPTKAPTADHIYVFDGWATTENGTKLDTNTVTINNANITMYPLFHTETRTYTVTWVNHTVIHTDTNLTLTDGKTTVTYDGPAPTRSTTDTEGYLFDGWATTDGGNKVYGRYDAIPITGDTTLYAHFELVPMRTVIWHNDTGTTELHTDRALEGSSLTYDGPTPTKDGHTFLGWATSVGGAVVCEPGKAITVNADVDTGVMNLYARFEPNTYTVTWQNWNGDVLETDSNVPYGTTPEYNGAIPTRPADVDKSYTFIGWTPDVDAITGDVTYTAKYSESTRAYTVIWRNYDNTLLKSESMDYGTEPSYTGSAPVRPETPTHTFTFIGWTPTISKVTGDITYTAAYQAVAKQFTATVHVWKDPTIDTETGAVTDGTLADLDGLASYNTLYLRDVSDDTNTKVYPLSKTDTGTYTASLTHGSYDVVVSNGSGGYNRIIEERIVLPLDTNSSDPDSTTADIIFYSVTYDFNGGTVDSKASVTEYYQRGTDVTVSNYTPTRSQYIFDNWQLDKNTTDTYLAGQRITVLGSGIIQPHTLKAKWIRSNDKVNVTLIIHHHADPALSGAIGMNPEVNKQSPNMPALNLDLTYRPAGSSVDYWEQGKTYQSTNWFSTGTTTDGKAAYNNSEYDTKTTTITLASGTTEFEALSSFWDYNANILLADYFLISRTVSESTDANGDTTYTVNATLQYRPDLFNLNYTVKVDSSVPAGLEPVAVDLKILSYDGIESNAWAPITRHQNTSVDVHFDDGATGRLGSGSYGVPVGKYYRVAVVGFTLPDGTELSATGGLVNYTSSATGATATYQYAAGAYTAEVTVTSDKTAADGIQGVYGVSSNSGYTQSGIIEVLVKSNAQTVTFDLNDDTQNPATLNGSSENAVLANQFRIPVLGSYIPTRTGNYVFDGWYLPDGTQAVTGTAITGNVTLTAKWKAPLTVSGEIRISTKDSKGNSINSDSLPTTLTVTLEHTTLSGDNIIAQSKTYTLTESTYQSGLGVVSYTFAPVAQDGSTYRIYINITNYDTAFLNEPNSNLATAATLNDPANYVGTRDAEDKDGDSDALIHAFLTFKPEEFNLTWEVDASGIGSAYRPDSLDILVRYNGENDDSTKFEDWNIIVQHYQNGVYTPKNTSLDATTGKATDFYPVWKVHSMGYAYDYAVKVHQWVKNNSRNDLTADTPFTVTYNPAVAWYENGKQITANPDESNLVITLTPKTYDITYVLNAEGDTVSGMTNAPDTHTWSKETTGIPTNPERKGYDFLGWKANVSGYSNGTISADTAQDITLTAQWQKQKVVTFQVVNGTWDGTNSDPIVEYVSLTDNSADIKGIIPTGMTANYGYGSGSWDDAALNGTTVTVTGSDPVTYTYTFQRIFHTVRYDSDGKDGIDTSDSVAHGNYICLEYNDGVTADHLYQLIEKDAELASPTREGYVFAGWHHHYVSETHNERPLNHRYVAQWLADVDEDGTADVYEKKVTFYVENGTWNGTNSDPITYYVNLTDNQANITSLIPTGIQPRSGFIPDGAFWSPNLPADGIVSGTSEVTYTYHHYTTVTYFGFLSQKMDEIHILPGSFISVDPNNGTWESNTTATIIRVNGPYELSTPTRENHTFLGWKWARGEGQITDTFTAQWEERTYTVTWLNESGDTPLETDTEVSIHTIPTYDGETPVKASTAEFSYQFAGWQKDGTGTVYTADTLPAVTADVTYRAAYTPIKNKYTVTWMNGDTVLNENDVEYGSKPVYVGTPTKDTTDEFTYTFSGWQKDGEGDIYTADAIPAVTGNVTYKAAFDAVTNQYTVTWQKEDGTTISSEEVNYNTVPTAPGAPVKTATAQYTYSFAGWKNIVTGAVYADAIPAVTGNVTYRATYTETTNAYTVTWENEDGTVLETDTGVAYGTTPTYDNADGKGTTDALAAAKNTEQYTYTFAGWNPSVSTVTGDVTYTATYTQTLNNYTVTWLNYNDRELEKDYPVPYGNVPSFESTKELTTEDANNHYTFLGWYVYGDETQTLVSFDQNDADVQKVTGNITYKAKYNVTPKARTATIHVWVNATAVNGTGGTPATIGTVTNGQHANLYLAPEVSADNSGTFIQASWDDTAKAYTASLLPGDYLIYAGNDASTAVREATQKVSIVDSSVTAHTLYNSVTYKDGTTTEGGNVIATEYYKSGSGPVYISKTVPTRSGYVFTNWSDGTSSYNASTDAVSVKLTDSIISGHTLTAQWSTAQTVTVVVNIDSRSGESTDPSISSKTLHLQLSSSTTKTGTYVDVYGTGLTAAYSTWTSGGNGTYTYTTTYANQRGDHYYQATALLAGYERESIAVSEDGKTVTISLKYDPEGFDLTFRVVVDSSVPDELVPRAVDVQIVFFDRASNQWKVLSNSQNKAIEVLLTKTDGIWQGTGTYHVWSKYTTGDLSGQLYLYRIAVTDFDLGTNRGSLTTTSTGDDAFKVYSSEAGTYHPAGAYTATVTVEDLNCSNGTAGGLKGSHVYETTQDNTTVAVQHGTITATVSVHPYSVVQHYNDGKTADKTTANRFLTPALDTPTRDDYTFAGWWTKDANGNWDTQVTAAGTPIMNLSPTNGTLNLYAKWNKDLTVTGTVDVSNWYKQGTAKHFINEHDRPDTIQVELRNMLTNALLYTTTATLTDVIASGETVDTADHRRGTYTFTGVPDNGTTYRITVAATNFTELFRNENAENNSYGADMYTVVDKNGDGTAVVDVSMTFAPATFDLEYTVDASAIGAGYRPSSAGVVVLYNDKLPDETQTDPQTWPIISQQVQGETVNAHEVGINSDGSAKEDDGSNGIWHKFPVWQQHPSGYLYGYAIQLYSLTHGTTFYDKAAIAGAPFSVVYSPVRAWYDSSTGRQTTPPVALSSDITLTHPDTSNPHGLVAYLIPREYNITYELGQIGTVDGATSLDGNTARGTFRWSIGMTELPAATASTSGVTFAGWYTKDSEGKWSNDPVTSIDPNTMENVTLYARWNYTVTWMNGSTVLDTDSVLEGTVPAYSGETPTKAPDSQYTYTWNGWTPTVSPVAGNITYTATFTNDTNTYTVTWKNEGGSVLETDEKVPYGTIPTYNGETPAKEATGQYTYTFDKWTPAVSAVTGDVTYTATFREILNTYTVIWKNHDGTVLETDSTVPYGQTAHYDGAAPTKAGDAQYSYRHTGWTPEVVAVEGHQEYTATFEQLVNTYTVTWKNADGSVLETDESVEYGATPQYNGATPTRNADAQYTYAFMGWDKEIVAVTGDVTYTALFLQSTNKYTVTWVNWDGTELESDETAYGETPKYDGATPTREADTQYTYTFKEWSPAVVAVTGNATYQATYSTTVNKYTVTWLDDNGDVLKREQVDYGTTPNYGADPTKDSTTQYTYKFTAWTPAITAVTGDVTYTASYSSTVNKYTVAWINEDGSPLTDAVEYEYGTVPTYTGATPVKAEDAQYTYTHSGWQTVGTGEVYNTTGPFPAVTGNVTYKALYSTTVKSYTVTWQNEDGSSLGSDTVAYGAKPVYGGETPTKSQTDEFTYAHSGWQKDGTGTVYTTDTLPAVTGNVTYRAAYSSAVRSYTVTWKNDDGEVLETDKNVVYGTKPNYDGNDPAKKSTPQYSYTFSGWSPSIGANTVVTGDVTYTATFTSTERTYTITWKNHDGTVLETDYNVAYNADPKYTGATPTKGSTAQYDYSHSGWDPKIEKVTGDAEYTATYSETLRSYTVTWENEDGTVLDTDTVEYGTMPEYNGEKPTKAADAQYTYTHNGWTPAITAVTGDVIYEATYSATRKKYTVNWLDENGTTVLKTEQVEYGTVPSYTGTTPTKEADAQHTYTFAGWNTDRVPVTGNQEYIATYTPSTRSYTITWKDEDGTVLKTETVAYGGTPTAPENPTKASTAQYNYTFKEWTPAVVAVIGDATYTATYTATLTTHTVTWVNYDGTELEKDENVAYGTTAHYGGSTPTRSEDAQYTYTFSGWHPVTSVVTGDVTYTAQYATTLRSYTITWKHEDDSVISTTVVKYGETPTHANPTKAATAQYTYTFAGWTPEVVAVTGDATYKATFTATTNTYTVTWINYDGTVLETDKNVEYGTMPEYNGEKPTHPDHNGKTYTFLDWDKTIAVVEGDITYQAKFRSEDIVYTINWVVDGHTTPETYFYGALPTYPNGTPAKAGDAQYSYTFTGWSPAITMVTENATYTAQFSTSTNQYTITWENEDGTVLDTDTVEYGAMPEYSGKTPAKKGTAQFSYEFKEWSPTVVSVIGDATYTATYTASKNKYTVTWTNWDGTVLETDEDVEYGTMPEYNGEKPAKASTQKYSYEFKEWTPATSPVSKDVTYTAAFEEILRSYPITWVDGNGNVLHTDMVEYGTMPKYNGEKPTKATDAQYTYSFNDSWSPAIETVTGEATYTAQFDTTVNRYTVKWIVEGGLVETDEDVEYGTTPTYDGATPTKSPTDTIAYAFAGWSPVVKAVTGDITYTATFTGSPRPYTITWMNGTTQLGTTTVLYGHKPVYAGATPTKEPDAQYTYTFIGWKDTVGNGLLPNALPPVIGDATYYADYSTTTNTYTVTWVNLNGTKLEVDTGVEYGATPGYNGNTPTQTADAQYTYTFSGWEPAISAVTGNVTYRATYSTTTNTYTVTWKNWDGTVLETDENVPYGTKPSYNSTTPAKAADAEYTYTHHGWIPSIGSNTIVTGDVTYTATFDAVVNKYTVIWMNGTTVVETDQNVPYGTTPTYDGATPTRTPDEQYTYAFSAWSPAVSDVTGDVTYYATYSTVLNKYTVTWKNGNTVLETDENVAYGTTPTYDGTTPVKATDEKASYTFSGWSPTVDAITGNTTYQATFAADPIKYTVTWMNGNTVLKTEHIAYGTVPVYSGTSPTREGTAEFNYVHSGWQKDDTVYTAILPEVTGDATYTAAFKETVKTYTIKWVVEGVTVETDTVEYGKEPAYNGDTPAKTATGHYSYVFSHWSPTPVTVTGNATYTAVFTSNLNTHPITWKDEDGTVLVTNHTAFGELPKYPGAEPTKKPTAQYEYTFTGWSPALEPVTGAAEYTATYSSSVRTYTVTWKDWDGTVLETDENVPYGTKPIYDADIPTRAADIQYTYTFADWTPTVEAITGETVYTANYSTTTNKYTVTWKNWDGSVLGTTEVPYGTVPVYGGTTPTRPGDTVVSYTHNGWTPALTAVTGEAVYTAIFTTEDIKYTVTYTDGVAGTDLFADQVYGNLFYGAATPAFSGTPSRPGYTFAGWSPAVESTVTGNTTYTAQWEVYIPAPVTGTVILTKVDSADTAKTLAGVVFDLYKANGTKVGTYTTNANGKITRTLSAGDYYWLETRPAEGYVMNNEKQSFTIRAGQVYRMTLTNTHAEVPAQFSTEHYAFVVGFDDGMVHPEANITRAEVATIFFRLLNETTRNQYLTRTNSFLDVKPTVWYNTAVSTMASMGVIGGYPDGTYRPKENITRAEFIALAAHFDPDGDTTPSSFTDIEGHWAEDEINIAANNGWTLGNGTGLFEPDELITRAEAMALVNRVLQRIPETTEDLLPNMVIWPDNMDPSKWYYLAVQEASSSHDYDRKANGFESWTQLTQAPDWKQFE